MPSHVTTSRECRPLRWIGYALLACAISFTIGLASAPHPPAATTPPNCTH
jgi:hypothetical protein